MKRCTNCGKYPFCEDIQEAGAENNCENWVKRNIEEIKEDCDVL